MSGTNAACQKEKISAALNLEQTEEAPSYFTHALPRARRTWGWTIRKGPKNQGVRLSDYNLSFLHKLRFCWTLRVLISKKKRAIKLKAHLIFKTGHVMSLLTQEAARHATTRSSKNHQRNAAATLLINYSFCPAADNRSGFIFSRRWFLDANIITVEGRNKLRDGICEDFLLVYYDAGKAAGDGWEDLL